MKYKSFISYKHSKNGRRHAQALETALKRYAKPTLSRPMRIFRDEKHMKPDISLPRLIREGLDNSEYLIFLAERSSASSQWCCEEIEYWCGDLQRSEKLIIILIDDEIILNGTENINFESSTALPRLLEAYIKTIPLYTDFRWAKTSEDTDLQNARYRHEINALSARLRGVSPEDLNDEEIRVFRRNIRLRNGAIGILTSMLLLSVVLAVWANNSARTATEQREIADINLQKAQKEEARARTALAQVEQEKAATEEQRKKAVENYDLAQQAKADAENARDSVQIALDDLEKKNANVARLNLLNADRDILNLCFEDALEKIKAAASLGTLKAEVAKHYLELAFWHGETGNLQRSAQLLDSIAVYTGNVAIRARVAQLSEDAATARNRLREAIKLMDAQHFDSLYTKKYYPDMVFVQGGKFIMGCDNAKDSDCGSDETPHEHAVSSFRIARTETTVWQFALYCAANGLNITEFLESNWSDPGDNPIVGVTWYDAIKYANWLSRQKGEEESFSKNADGFYSMNLKKGYRLPTEGEWEYAAGGGSDNRTKYAGTNDDEQLKNFAWCNENSGGRTRSVGALKANSLGLYDMSGNAWEWCWDRYDDYLANSGKDYSAPPGIGNRVLRGGSWFYYCYECRSAVRASYDPGIRDNNFGFRVSQHL